MLFYGVTPKTTTEMHRESLSGITIFPNVLIVFIHLFAQSPFNVVLVFVVFHIFYYIVLKEVF